MGSFSIKYEEGSSIYENLRIFFIQNEKFKDNFINLYFRNNHFNVTFKSARY